MPGLLDFVNKNIVSCETVEHTAYGQIDWGRRFVVNISHSHKKYCKTIYSEPVLCLKLKDAHSKIEDLSCLVKQIFFEIGGQLVDKMCSEQINILQHKCNIMPRQHGDTILIPLPLNCLLKNNGIIFNDINYFEQCVRIELMETNNTNAICSGCVYVNYTYIKHDTDLSELTMLNYHEVQNTKFHHNSLLKINNKLPSDFISYYFITELLNKKDRMYNIYESHSDNITAVNEDKKAHENILIERVSKSSTFNIPITLLKINQSQFTGEELLPDCECAKFKMVFENDVNSLYLQFKCKDNNTVLNDKWFDNIQIRVNGNIDNVLEYTYEMLCLYKQNNRYNLPNGVLEIPNIKYIDWKSSQITLIMSNIKRNNNANITVSIFAESDNYLVCGSQSKLLFQA